MPRKKPVIEEGTATWNKHCTEGWTYMNQLAALPDAYDLSLISVHGGDWDPMQLDEYNDYLFYLDWNYIPFFLFDRRFKVSGDSFTHYYNHQKRSFGYASVEFDYYLSGTELQVNTHVIPALDMDGDFRVALVLTEDDVKGTGDIWRQANKYAGGKLGPMGGFELKADTIPAADMHYNFVARAVAPSPDGKPGGLPKKLLHNIDYPQTLKINVDPKWNKDRLKLIVMLVRYDDSTILNSNKMLFYMNVNNNNAYEPEIQLYPNPTSSNSYVKIKGCKGSELNLTITDMFGKTIINSPYSVDNHTTIPLNTSYLPSGMYLVNLHGDDFSKTLKLSVIH
jgi:hypothetical protein